MSDPHQPVPQDIGVPGPADAGTGASAVLRITAVAAGGRGVAREAGRVWFVSGGLPGDRLRARALRQRQRYVEARMTALLDPSPDRRPVPCALQDRCGGCPWMPLSPELQAEWKRRGLVEALARIGGLQDPQVDLVRRPVAELGYRNRAEFVWGLGGNGQPVVGLHHGDGERGLVDIPRCPIQSDPANAILGAVRAFLLDPRSGPPPAAGEAFRISIRYSSEEDRSLVGLWDAARPFPRAAELARHLSESQPRLAGVVRLHGREERRGGRRLEVLAGREWIRERVGGLTFRVPAATFLQVSSAGAEAVIQAVLELARPLAGRRVFDLYGGVGALALALRRAGASSVTVCDADREAIRCGRGAARGARIDRVRFVHAAVERFLRRPPAPEGRPDLIVANPPRSGLRAAVTQALAGMAPPRLILVSCDPATLARDLHQLLGAGYTTRRIVPLDLFPQTAHVETVVSLEHASIHDADADSTAPDGCGVSKPASDYVRPRLDGRT